MRKQSTSGRIINDYTIPVMRRQWHTIKDALLPAWVQGNCTAGPAACLRPDLCFHAGRGPAPRYFSSRPLQVPHVHNAPGLVSV